MGEAPGGLAVRPPQQARSRRAWQRILDSGLELVEEQGFDGLTIGELCERAGVTPPSVYARAPSKEALLLALYEHALDRISTHDTLEPDDPRWAELDGSAVVREAVGSLCRIWLANAALMRAIVKRAGTDAETFRRGSEESIAAAQRFRAILLARPDLTAGAATAARAERRVDACFRIVYAALVQRVMFGADFESDLRLSDAELQSTLTAAVLAYLRHSEEE